MKEIWKDIPGYENLYQVSNKGRIKSLYNYKRNGTNILVPRLKRGYYTIGLRKNGIRKWVGNIVSCCKGNSKYSKVKGYIWKYKEVV